MWNNCYYNLPIQIIHFLTQLLVLYYQFYSHKFTEICNTTTAFKCRDQTCISKGYLCDNENDCPDGSDEVNCNTFTYKTCDDVWSSGTTKSGVYIMGKNKFIKKKNFQN
jgi:hypothetical protein